MVRKCFRGTGKTENFVLGKIGMKLYFGNMQLSGGKSAGFIKNGVFGLSKAFAVFGTFDKNTVF